MKAKLLLISSFLFVITVHVHAFAGNEAYFKGTLE